MALAKKEILERKCADPGKMKTKENTLRISLHINVKREFSHRTHVIEKS